MTVNAILREPVHFNEVLSVLYREGQKMSWHDDGEEGAHLLDLEIESRRVGLSGRIS